MDEYLKAMNGFNDIGNHVGSAAASFYNTLVDSGVPDHFAAPMTDTFIIELFNMFNETASRNAGDTSKQG